MKRNLRSTMLAIFFFATLAMSMAPTAQAEDEGGCSNVTAAGEWGLTTTGTVFVPAQTGAIATLVAIVGRFTLDAKGNLVGNQTRSLNGVINQETFTGTINVNPACTATATIDVFHSGVLNRTATLDLVFVDDLDGFRGVFTSAVTASGASIATVLLMDGKRVLRRD